MKRIAIALLLITAVLSVAACKAKPEAGTSSTVDTVSEAGSVVLNEGDFFTQNGTESEFKITESEIEELFEKQESIDQENGEDKASSEADSSDNVSSKDSESVTSADNEASASSDKDGTVSGEESQPAGTDKDTDSKTQESKPTASASKYDKDGDGWTDGWN